MNGIKGPSDLEKDVLKQKLCAVCGACVGLCPYFGTFEGRVVMMDSCKLTQGRCYAFCPRTTTDMEALRSKFFDPNDFIPEIGPFRGLYITRSSDKKIRTKSQHGGSMTALVELAMKEGFIDAAVLTCAEGTLNPNGIIASKPEEIRRCAGSSFQIPPSLSVLNQALKENRFKKIGVVGTPCKTLAVYKMKDKPFADNDNHADSIAMVFGLFCGWGIDWKGLERVIKNKTPLDKVMHVDILPSKFQVMEVKTKKGRIKIPLEEIIPIVRESCRYCTDMTAEYCDLSIGGARSLKGWDFDRGWNQVIVRTQKGQDLLELARAKKVLEFREVQSENLEKLKRASKNKKKNALENIRGKTGDDNNLLYVNPQDATLKDLLHKAS
jgi:coenzyme F420 hydrogenase subunit beta